MESNHPTLELTAGLSAKEVHRRLLAAHRATDLGHRTLAFYLHDMHQRSLHLLFSCSSAAHYAEARLGLGERIARELVYLGGKLLELLEVDRAFADGRLSWTKVRILCRVVTEETQAAWIERALELPCRKLEQQVRARQPGDLPPRPRQLGLPELRFSVQVSLSAVEQQLWEQAKEKLAAECGKPVTDAELMRLAAERMLAQSQQGQDSAASRFQVVVHRCPDCGESAVETEAGRVGLHAAEAAAIDCDAERRSLQADGAVDQPTPERLRRAVLARDGGQCSCCGSRAGVQVHHLVFRSLGGPTSQENLACLCGLCHTLVHHGQLRIEGTVERGLQFLDGDGQPLDKSRECRDPLVLMLVSGEPGTRVPDHGPEPIDLDSLPDGSFVDAEWFWANEHRFKWELAPPGRRPR